MNDIAGRIDRLLAEPQMPDLVALYFMDEQPFAGHLFDEIGENPWNRFSTDDVLAITFLDVALEPRAVRSLMDPAATWNKKLQAITPDRKLWEASDDDLAEVDELWTKVIKELPGVGPTKASKLLARKRPHLVPIYDQVIGRFLQPTHGEFWAPLREALQSDERRSGIDRLASGLARPRSTIRVLDVAIWMRCGRSRNAQRARSSVGLPLEPLTAADS